jgi:phosphohistidine phosphatase
MRTLYLLRHAKSSWASPLLDDFERPLNKRGREAAPRIGRLLRKREMIPDLVLCSAARRATETWELAGQAIGRDLPVKGHNPGMERCAAQLVGPGSDAGALADLEAKYPTAAVAAFAFDAEKWRDLDFGAGRLTAFLKPQD